jgi:hypothetical protein
VLEYGVYRGLLVSGIKLVSATSRLINQSCTILSTLPTYVNKGDYRKSQYRSSHERDRKHTSVRHRRLHSRLLLSTPFFTQIHIQTSSISAVGPMDVVQSLVLTDSHGCIARVGNAVKPFLRTARLVDVGRCGDRSSRVRSIVWCPRLDARGIFDVWNTHENEKGMTALSFNSVQ